MNRPSFQVIRDLIGRVRKHDEEARLVLHDALIERYGELYLKFVRQAQRGFVGKQRPAFVVVFPQRLAERESWVKVSRRVLRYVPGTGSSKAKGPIPFAVAEWPGDRDIVSFVSAPMSLWWKE